MSMWAGKRKRGKQDKKKEKNVGILIKKGKVAYEKQRKRQGV